MYVDRATFRHDKNVNSPAFLSTDSLVGNMWLDREEALSIAKHPVQSINDSQNCLLLTISATDGNGTLVWRQPARQSSGTGSAGDMFQSPVLDSLCIQFVFFRISHSGVPWRLRRQN